MTTSRSARPGQQSPMLVATPDGPRVIVHEWGNPRGPEILLIHGVAQSHLCFERQFTRELAREHRIVAYDVRGHGGSDKPLERSSIPTASAGPTRLRAVIDAKGLRRPVLVGWSLGGRIAAQYLLHHGDERLSGVNFVASRVIPDKRYSGPASLALPQADPRDLAGHVAMATGSCAPATTGSRRRTTSPGSSPTTCWRPSRCAPPSAPGRPTSPRPTPRSRPCACPCSSRTGGRMRSCCRRSPSLRPE